MAPHISDVKSPGGASRQGSEVDTRQSFLRKILLRQNPLVGPITSQIGTLYRLSKRFS